MLISDLLQSHPTTEVTVSGWVRTTRAQKKNSFVEIYDGGPDHLQLFIPGHVTYKTGASITATGTLVESPGKGQKYELKVTSHQLIGDVCDDYPIVKTELTMDFLRQLPHLRIRTDTHQAIQRVKSEVMFAITCYFREQKFTQIQPTEITDNLCESGADPFLVVTPASQEDLAKHGFDSLCQFFKKKVALTVSSQLHLETMVCGGLSRAWCMSLVFRAEPSRGPLHLAEFSMPEYESCFSTLEENMQVSEGCLKYVFQHVLTHCQTDLQFLAGETKLLEMLARYVATPFVRTTHQNVVQMMLDDVANGEVTFDELPTFDGDLTKQHEKYITGTLFDGLPVFVRFFPKKIKSFYMPVIDKGQDVEHVDGFDLLFPEIGEIVGGSQREADYDTLVTRMKECGIDPDTMTFYSDQRKYGTVPHGGAGIGLDRLMMVITGVHNIQDMIPYPRKFEQCKY